VRGYFKGNLQAQNEETRHERNKYARMAGCLAAKDTAYRFILCDVLAMPNKRVTTIVKYITPANISSATKTRAGAEIGKTSVMPTPLNVAKLKNSNSSQERGSCAFANAIKLCGYHC
jgi:hypothetical protein